MSLNPYLYFDGQCEDALSFTRNAWEAKITFMAARLAGEQGEAIAALAPRQMRSGWPMIVRTRLIDGLVLASLRDGCDCVVNLAAGLDTRPYRLPLPASLTWIEADLPGMI